MLWPLWVITTCNIVQLGPGTWNGCTPLGTAVPCSTTPMLCNKTGKQFNKALLKGCTPLGTPPPRVTSTHHPHLVNSTPSTSTCTGTCVSPMLYHVQRTKAVQPDRLAVYQGSYWTQLLLTAIHPVLWQGSHVHTYIRTYAGSHFVLAVSLSCSRVVDDYVQYWKRR